MVAITVLNDEEKQKKLQRLTKIAADAIKEGIELDASEFSVRLSSLFVSGMVHILSVYLKPGRSPEIVIDSLFILMRQEILNHPVLKLCMLLRQEKGASHNDESQL